MQQEGMEEVLKGKDVPPDARAMIKGLADSGHPVSGWNDDPFIYKIYFGMMQQTMLINDVGKTIDPNDPRFVEKLDKLLNDLRDDLRSHAEISIK